MHKAPIHGSLISQMQGWQPARKSSFYAFIDYVRHRQNFSAAATWVRGLLPTNHVQRPCPVLKRFSSTHSLRGSSWPGGQTDSTATREWFTTSVADHSAHQADRAVMSSAGWLHHIGRLEERR